MTGLLITLVVLQAFSLLFQITVGGNMARLVAIMEALARR